MSEERPNSSPAGTVSEGGTGVSDSTQPPPSVRHRDPGRVPAIPGLIAPRFVSRASLDGTAKPASDAAPEAPGLMRPQLPYRKAVQTPAGAESSAKLDAAATSEATETEWSETAVPPAVSEQPLLQQRPLRPGVPVDVPLQARRPSPVHPASTLTAMRIISIGVEDDPTASELTYPDNAHSAAGRDQLAPAANPAADLPELDDAQLFPIGRSHRILQSLPELDEAQLQPVATMRAATGSLPELDQDHLQPLQRRADSSPELEMSALPAFDLPDGAELGTPTEQLPSFELREHASEPPTSSLSDASVAVAPLPSFELPETDEPPGTAADDERLPSFDFEPAEPSPARQEPSSSSKLAVPSAPSRPLAASSEAKLTAAPAVRGTPAPSAPTIEVRQSPPPPPPPKPARSAPQPVVLSEDDLSPDSVKPAPPTPPSRSLSAPRAPGDISVPPNARVPTAVLGDAARSAPVEAEGQTQPKRNPPRPPQRRSYPALADSGQEAPAAASTKSRPSETSDASTEKARAEDKARARRPWWEELFNEDFSRALNRLSEAQIKREATFIEESLGVSPGGVVLDLGCGAGYHAVELAQRGYAVVGYDLSLHQLALAADVAQERQQKLNLMQGDMREMAFDSVFDGIYCWDTTFGYFEEEKNLAVAAKIFQALKPGGTFLVDTINRDFVTMQQPSSVWFEGDSAVCMDDMSVDFISSRLRVKRSVMLDDGRTKECHYSIRLYSLHELGKLLHEVGFRIAEASGQPSTPGVFMGQNAPRIIILAQRP